MKRNLPLLILLVCVIAFALGVAELFKLRFQSGDVYPPYSSLRSDPLGTSAFYESLGKIPGISVNRDFRMTDELPEGKGVVYLHLAGDPDDWDEMTEKSYKEVENFLRGGGRLVVALEPIATLGWRSSSASTNLPATTPVAKSKKDKETAKAKKSFRRKLPADEKYTFEKTVSLTQMWGFDFGFRPLKPDGDVFQPVAVTNVDEPALPASMPWHSGTVLTNLDDNWQVIYARGSDAVLAMRRFGPGALVLSTDSYFFSNEALRKDRSAPLLSWIIGPGHQIYFDEAHLGIVNEPGIATLMRTYHLQGLAAGLLLLAGLYIWKNSISFAPPHEAEAVETAIIGKDSATGFVNLLRRNIKSSELLNLCVIEWKKSLPSSKFTSARVNRVESLLQNQNSLPPAKRNPVSMYRIICKAMKENITVNTPEHATRNTQYATHFPIPFTS